MGLNVSKGNMYDFISHTFNTTKGKCFHNCSYCYMKRFGSQKPVRFDAKELKTDLGSGNFIFIGSSCDMFAKDINMDWIIQTLNHCKAYPNNRYFFQTKNPTFIANNRCLFPSESVICTTIETNRFYPEIMGNSPFSNTRASAMANLDCFDKYVTIEPIMDFDLDELVDTLRACQPIQVNIGADSGRNNLPEPSKEKLLELIAEIQRFTTIHKKSNLERILKNK